MNKIISLFTVLIAGIIILSSCNKDEGKLPNISFKTGSTYTSGDKTAAVGDSITVGINASKSEEEDILKTFDASVAANGGGSTSFYSQSLSGNDNNSYSKDLGIKIKDVGVYVYKFTVVNRDGLTNNVSFTLTVK